MNRTVELLELEQERLRVANTTVIPAVRAMCLDQHLGALRELMEHRSDLRRTQEEVRVWEEPEAVA
jgi:hypothetical protein